MSTRMARFSWALVLVAQAMIEIGCGAGDAEDSAADLPGTTDGAATSTTGPSGPSDSSGSEVDSGVPSTDPIDDIDPVVVDLDADVPPEDTGPVADAGTFVPTPSADAAAPPPDGGGGGGGGGFVHPGALVSRTQLDFVKAQIVAQKEPWLSAFNKLKGNTLARTTYTASPVPKLMCSTSVGLGEGFPQAGCTQLNNDAAAAYAQSLMWFFTGNQTYAANAIKIMNAWATTLIEIPYDQPRTKNGEPAYWQNMLVVGWSTETMGRAAEIIRYTNTSWATADITKVENLFKKQFYPLVSNSFAWTSVGNGGFTWAESLMNIGIFTNDQAIYKDGLLMWKSVVKNSVYMPRDGAQPAYPTNPKTGKVTYGTPALVNGLWKSPTSYFAGLEIETCRDLGHTFMGLGAFANGAETARIQGTDLYGDPEYKDRFLTTFELNAGYVNQLFDRMAATGQTAAQVTASSWVPSGTWVCPDFKDGGGSASLGNELAYNHFVHRLGLKMPQTEKLALRTRYQAGGNHLFWETLTHAGTP